MIHKVFWCHRGCDRTRKIVLELSNRGVVMLRDTRKHKEAKQPRLYRLWGQAFMVSCVGAVRIELKLVGYASSSETVWETD